MGKIIKTAGESGGRGGDNRNDVAGKKSKKRLKKELKKAAKKAKLEPNDDSNNEAENSIEPALDQEEEAEEDLEEGEVSSVIAAGIISEAKMGGFDAEVAKILAKANQLVAQDGENKIPSLHLNLETFSRGLVSIESVRDLVLWCLSDGANPKWMLVKHWNMATKAVVILVPGLDSTAFLQCPININMVTKSRSVMPINIDEYIRLSQSPDVTKLSSFLSQTFKHAVPIEGPGDRRRVFSPAKEFLEVPFSSNTKDRRKKKKDVGPLTPITLEDCILSTEEMLEAEYTLPSKYRADPLPEGWVESKERSEENSFPTALYYAIDCEMCVTEAGYELTRVSVVSNDNTVVMDELVKPDLPIIDYVTEFSGITAIMMEPVQTKLKDIQERLLKLIDQNTPLLGHSLNSDLTALKFAHATVIDTSLLFHHTRGPPARPGLKWLALKWLNKDIQLLKDKQGHDSVEDARACIDLLKLKLAKGKEFGWHSKSGESIFKRLNRSSVSCAMVDYGGPVSMMGDPAAHLIACETDEAVAQGVKECIMKEHNFIWGRFKSLDVARDKATESAQILEDSSILPTTATTAIETTATDTTTTAETTAAESDDLAAAAEKVNEYLTEIYESLPRGTIFMLLSGLGDVRRCLQLCNKQRNFEQLYKTKLMEQIPVEDLFTEKDFQELQVANFDARLGVGFFSVKQ